MLTNVWNLLILCLFEWKQHFYMLYEKWLNFELLRNESQCMLFFWSFDYSRRACAFHPGSNKSDFVPVEYSTFFSSSNSSCGWVEMEAEMERLVCSCVFVCVDLKSPWIWTAVFGIVQCALKCVSCVLACPVPQQRSHLTSSIKECSGSTEFEAWFWLPQNFFFFFLFPLYVQ